MINIHDVVAELGGFALKHELVGRGARDKELTKAIRDGTVLRARNGWYSTSPVTSPQFQAVRVGGRLTGASALRVAGAWIPEPVGLHVSVPRNASRLRSPSSRRRRLHAGDHETVVVHWDDGAVLSAGSRTSVSIADALLAYILTATLEWAIAALDWASGSGHVDLIEFERVFLRLPARLRNVRSWVDPNCDSVMESLARTRLRMSGHHVTSQVLLGELERIDLVIDGDVALELDGKEFHERRFERDRRKDLRITVGGRHAIRVTYSMLLNSWGTVHNAIVCALTARGHPMPQHRFMIPAGANPSTPMREIGRRGQRFPSTALVLTR